MKSRVIALIAVCMVAAGTFAADREIVRLTIEEEAGSARTAEPVTMGVPLPEGMVQDVKTLAMKNAQGKILPCQFVEVSRWRTDKGGARWVHADFQVSVPAKGTTVVAVVDTGAAVTPPKTQLTAAEANGAVTVVTGPVKFVVRGAKFNGFDGAWFDPSGKGAFGDSSAVIVPGKDGGSRAAADGKTGLSLNDADGKVEIERSGPMKVVVKATGSHRDAAGERVFDYIVRFHAYAGSPIVRVQHTFVNRQGGRPADRLLMTDLAFEAPTAMAKPQVTLGTDTDPWTGSASGDAACAVQKTSDELAVMLGAASKATGKGKSTKPLSSGWIDLSGGGKNLACGVRWFWQMWPKAVGAKPDGTLRVGLFPSEAGMDWEVFMGQSRTHDLTFLFHKGVAAKDLNAFFVGTQRPLRAFASPAYYCRTAKAFGPIADSDPALFGDDWAKVQEHDAVMLKSIERILKNLDGEKRNGRVHESYGFYAWGDSYHWSWPNRGKSPNDRPEWTYSYEGNYYDFPNACLLQFVRTGEKKFLERFEPNARHVGDLFMCQHHPKPQLCGACRYCPPRNHVSTDDGAPYVSIEFNHAKSQCVFNHYYLYGDLRSLDNALLLANNALNNHAADSGWAARGLGAHLAQLWCAWELTGDTKYRDRIKGMVRKGIGQTRSGTYKKGGRFMWGIADEGMIYAYWVTGDTVIVDALKSAYPARIENGYLNGNMVLPAAFVNAMTGDAACRDFAWKNLEKPRQGGKAGPITRPKDYGMSWRNAAYGLYYLSKAWEQDKASASGE